MQTEEMIEARDDVAELAAFLAMPGPVAQTVLELVERLGSEMGRVA